MSNPARAPRVSAMSVHKPARGKNLNINSIIKLKPIDSAIIPSTTPTTSLIKMKLNIGTTVRMLFTRARLMI